MKKQQLLELFQLPDPYVGFTPKADSTLWGWNGDRPIFGRLINQVRPQTVIEVGTWLGLSTINMAKHLQMAALHDSSIIAIDTWLGSKEHWQDPEMLKYLELSHGFPTLYERFISNVIAFKCEDIIVPLPMPSHTAAAYLKDFRAQVELIYIDGSHEEQDVFDDLENYWDILAPGGIVFGDDWPRETVARAVKRFCIDKKVQYQLDEINWIIQKPL